VLEGGQVDLRGQCGERAGRTHASILPEAANGFGAVGYGRLRPMGSGGR